MNTNLFNLLVYISNNEHSIAEKLEDPILKEIHIGNMRAAQRILRIINTPEYKLQFKEECEIDMGTDNSMRID